MVIAATKAFDRLESGVGTLEDVDTYRAWTVWYRLNGGGEPTGAINYIAIKEAQLLSALAVKGRTP